MFRHRINPAWLPRFAGIALPRFHQHMICEAQRDWSFWTLNPPLILHFLAFMTFFTPLEKRFAGSLSFALSSMFEDKVFLS